MLHFIEIWMKNWLERTHIVLSLKPGYFAGSGWLFGERCCTLPSLVRDDRWEKHERSGASRWHKSHNLITIPCNPILGNCTCNHFVICYLRPPGVYELPHYASEALVGRRCSHAEELGQGKDENNRIGMVSVVKSIKWD